MQLGAMVTLFVSEAVLFSVEPHWVEKVLITCCQSAKIGIPQVGGGDFANNRNSGL